MNLRQSLYQNIAADYHRHRRQGIDKTLLLYKLMEKYFVSETSIRKHIDLKALDADAGVEFQV